MCTDKNNDKNKMNLSLIPTTPVAVFLIDEKLRSQCIWHFQAFRLFLLTFCEKLSVIARVDSFVLHICWSWIEKNIFFNFMNFNPPYKPNWKFFLFWNFLSYLVSVPSFKSINSSSLSQRMYDGGTFTPNLRQR